MLDSFKDVGLSLNGEDGYPNHGFEMDEKILTVYVHRQTRLKAGPHAKGCPVYAAVSCLPGFSGPAVQRPQLRLPVGDSEGHHRDPGRAKAFAAVGHPYEMLMTCNDRTMEPLAEQRAPAMYMLKITCPMDQVTAKSGFPLRMVEDVSFVDVYSVPEDNTPFDIRDIIAKRKQGL